MGGDIPQLDPAGLPPAASMRPSGLIATLVMAPIAAVSGGPSGLPVVTSHSCTSPRLPPAASVCPSRLNATLVTEPIAALSGAPSGLGWGHPTAAPAALAAGREYAPVRAERDAGVGLGGQRGTELVVGGDVPQLHGAIVAAGGERAARRG